MRQKSQRHIPDFIPEGADNEIRPARKDPWTAWVNSLTGDFRPG